MFRYILITAILILFLGSVFCSRNPGSSINGDEITLSYGQSVSFGPDKIKIKFDTLLTESRCPDNPLIVCFWQGMAAIQLSLITQDNDTAKIVVKIEGLTGYPESDNYPAIDTLGLSIDLINLDPYPHTDQPRPLSEYRAMLKVKPSTSISGIDGRVMIIDANPNNLLRDDYSIDSAKIEDDILTLSVAYGGGCKTHYFYAYVHSAIMESNPPQINLYLHHFGNNDFCKVLVHQNLKFDLNPLAEYFKQSEPGYTLIINVHEYLVDTPQLKISVPFYIAYPPD